MGAMSQEPQSHRRDFLKGRAAADALEHYVDARLSDLDAEPASEAGYLVRIGRRAMACEFEVLLNAGEYPDGAEHALAALDLVDELESQLTVYRESSEVVEINRQAGTIPVAVEARLFELLRFAKQLHLETEGAYDITSGPLTKVWGFSRRQGSVPSQADLNEALARVGSQRLRLDESARTIAFETPGMELNLGSIGKGYALDRVAAMLAAQGITQMLIHGGQSSVLARGGESGSPEGWTVGVVDPLRPGRRIAEIRLRDQALGTSGASTQFFRHSGRRYGHILDPRTGWPAEGILSTTVVAPSGAMADALATAFYVWGVEPSLAYCRARPEISALLIAADESGQGVKVHTAGFAGNSLRRLDLSAGSGD